MEDKAFAEHLVDESVFAKVVYTKDGPGILIAGFVINVSASPIIGVDVAEVLVTALRRNRTPAGAFMASGQGSTSIDA